MGVKAMTAKMMMDKKISTVPAITYTLNRDNRMDARSSKVWSLSTTRRYLSLIFRKNLLPFGFSVLINLPSYARIGKFKIILSKYCYSDWYLVYRFNS